MDVGSCPGAIKGIVKNDTCLVAVDGSSPRWRSCLNSSLPQHYALRIMPHLSDADLHNSASTQSVTSSLVGSTTSSIASSSSGSRVASSSSSFSSSTTSVPSLSGGESYASAGWRQESRLETSWFPGQRIGERSMQQLGRLDALMGDWQKACQAQQRQ